MTLSIFYVINEIPVDFTISGTNLNINDTVYIGFISENIREIRV
jgi:hypothetical protein